MGKIYLKNGIHNIPKIRNLIYKGIAVILSIGRIYSKIIRELIDVEIKIK